jgi:hypothetical protein
VCEVVVKLRDKMAKLTTGSLVYKGPTELTEFTVIKYILTDKGNEKDGRSQVRKLDFFKYKKNYVEVDPGTHLGINSYNPQL